MNVGGMGTSLSVEVTTHIISQIPFSMVSPEVAVSLPHSVSIPTTHRATQPILGDPRPSFIPNFTLPPSGREYSYGMSTGMMKDLQVNASALSNNLYPG